MPSAPAKSRNPGPPSTLLLAEEDVIVRFALAEHLRSCAYRVIEAATALEAKAVLQAGPNIDILLSDAQLAGPNGFALSQWVRRNRPQIEVVLAGTLDRKAQSACDLCARDNRDPPSQNAVANLTRRIKTMMDERDKRARKRSASAAITSKKRRVNVYQE